MKKRIAIVLMVVFTSSCLGLGQNFQQKPEHSFLGMTSATTLQEQTSSGNKIIENEITELLKRRHGECFDRFAIAKELEKFGDSAVHPLITALRDTDNEKRYFYGIFFPKLGVSRSIGCFV